MRFGDAIGMLVLWVIVFVHVGARWEEWVAFVLGVGALNYLHARIKLVRNRAEGERQRLRGDELARDLDALHEKMRARRGRQ